MSFDDIDLRTTEITNQEEEIVDITSIKIDIKPKNLFEEVAVENVSVDLDNNEKNEQLETDLKLALQTIAEFIADSNSELPAAQNTILPNIEELKRAVQTVLKVVDEANAAKKQLQIDLASVQSEQFTIHQQKLLAVKQVQQNFTAEIFNLENKIKNLESALQEANAKIRKLDNSKSMSNAIISDSTVQIEKKETEIKDLLEMNEILKNQLRNFKVENIALTREKRELLTKLLNINTPTSGLENHYKQKTEISTDESNDSEDAGLQTLIKAFETNYEQLEKYFNEKIEMLIEANTALTEQLTVKNMDMDIRPISLYDELNESQTIKSKDEANEQLETDLQTQLDEAMQAKEKTEKTNLENSTEAIKPLLFSSFLKNEEQIFNALLNLGSIDLVNSLSPVINLNFLPYTFQNEKSLNFSAPVEVVTAIKERSNLQKLILDDNFSKLIILKNKKIEKLKLEFIAEKNKGFRYKVKKIINKIVLKLFKKENFLKILSMENIDKNSEFNNLLAKNNEVKTLKTEINHLAKSNLLIINKLKTEKISNEKIIFAFVEIKEIANSEKINHPEAVRAKNLSVNIK